MYVLWNNSAGASHTQICRTLRRNIKKYFFYKFQGYIFSRRLADWLKMKIKEKSRNIIICPYADKLIETGQDRESVSSVSTWTKSDFFKDLVYTMRKVFYRCKQNFHAVVLLLTVLEVCLQWNGPSLGFAMSQYTGSVVEESLVTMEYRDCWVSVSSGRSLYWASRFVMEIGWNSDMIYQISKVSKFHVTVIFIQLSYLRI